MSYAVCRMQKMKQHDLKGMQFHNQRERNSQTNFDIDSERTKENYDLVNDGDINYNERIKQIIEEQKITTRKIRKDAVMVNELLVTSDKEFFDSLSKENEKRFFEESKTLFEERYGKQNIAYAMVHVDEKTPHMHLGVVPMRDGKLQGKNIFNQKELRWIQDEFPKRMKQKGFDLKRGEKGSDKKHLSAQRYKLQTLKDEIKTLEGDLQAVEVTNEKLEGITSENKEKRSMGFVGPEKVEMPKDNYEKLYGMAQRSHEHAKERERIEEENWKLKEKQKKMEKENDQLKSENSRLVDLLQNEWLKRELLEKTLEVLKDRLKDKTQTFARHVGYAKAKVMTRLKFPEKEKKMLYQKMNYLASNNLLLK
ncbi:MobV family relaxase [Thalassobacillus sp. C254]|uniref:MobV family relaxase n=1 Tax=Thalassobacillus sp. C254 TaxID=1225341 RepID=UPI000A6C41E6|nr:MobV family relaxase [Thalassobacillus sp. C254]